MDKETHVEVMTKPQKFEAHVAEDIDSEESDILDERRMKASGKNPIKFKKCKTNIDEHFNVIKAHGEAEGQEEVKSKKKKKSPPRQETLYALKHIEGQPMSTKVFFGIKLREDLQGLKGAYVFYNKDLPNKAGLDMYSPLMPAYGGCKRKFSLKDKHRLKSVELIYEHLPYWVSYFEMTQTPMNNLIMVEMVHQLFMFFYRLFPTGMYAKNFDSRFIGVRKVPDVNVMLGFSQNVYLNKNLAFIFKNVEALDYHCRFREEEDFQHLKQIFVSEKKRKFKIKNESKMEICQQMNLYNLLKMLEIALYRSAGIQKVDDHDFFIGCLDEPEDRDHKCPTVILAALGMDVNKVRYEFTKSQRVHLKALKQLRKNLLAYTTESFKKWFGIFLKELLIAFRKRPIRVIPSLKLDASKILGLIKKFQASIAQIKQIQESTGDHEKFKNELAQITEGLEKLLALKDKLVQQTNVPQTPKKTIEKNNEDVDNQIKETVIDKSEKTALVSTIMKDDSSSNSDMEDVQQIKNQIDHHIESDHEHSPQSSNSSVMALDLQRKIEDDLKDVEEIDELEMQVDDEIQKKESGKNPLTESMKYSFADDEQLAFVQRVDKSGMEYISMEINLNLINPKDFGFQNYKESDEKALHQVVQKFFLSELKKDPNLEGMVMEIEKSNFLI
jgi:hypothetical protein